MTSLSVVILTYNEEIHLARAIRSLAALDAKIFVVDSFSTDRTAEIAEAMGASVTRHEFANYAKQFQWALDNCPIETEWVMRLDADEVLEPELAQEIDTRLAQLPQDVTGVNLRRRHIFMERFIRHGGRYPLILLRIWRHGMGRIEQRWMDEHIVLSQGTTVTFKHDFADHNLKDIGWWTDKHNKYATREAIDILNQKHRLFKIDDHMDRTNDRSQAGIKRSVKERIYNAMPLFSGPVLYFLYRYFLRLGFLDGREGFAYHFLQGFWYRVLVEVKVMELEKGLRVCDGQGARLAKLEKLTGYSLS